MDLPIFLWRVPAGFPSPAEDWVERRLDLNDLLIPHPVATFFVRVSGDSMIGAGIHDGDIVIVDRAVEAAHNTIIIAMLDGDFTVKRLQIKEDAVFLQPENPAYLPLEVTSREDFHIWGVVTYVIHSLQYSFYASLKRVP